MSKILSEVLEANAKYSVNFGEKGKLAMPPARRFAILTCMDARLDPAKFADLAEGILPPAQTRRLMDLCWNVEKLSQAGDVARAGAQSGTGG